MKYIYLILLSLISSIGFSQTNGITYQAVILNPVEGELPGVNHTNVPLANTAICLKFGIIDQNSMVEYSETIQTTTDKFGMVNLIIGTGSKIAGYANTFSDVQWNTDAKNLQVHLSTTGNCSSYIEISNQPFTYVPFALNALNAQKQVNTLNSTVSNNIANISAVQASVDANESAANNAIANNTTNITTNAAGITALETLADGKIYLGDGSNVTTEVTMSGDVTIDNTGATTIGTLANLTVTNAIAGSITGTSANVTGVVAIATGGTGSSTQNFVDLTTDQTVAGAKTFSNEMAVIGNVTASGTITAGAITIPNTDGTDGQVLVTDGSGTLTWQTTSITEADSAVIADFGFVANRTDMVIGKLVDYQTTIASVGRLQIRYSSNATGGYLEARTLSGSINSMVYSTRKKYNWDLTGNTSVTNFHSNSGQYPTAWTPLIPLWNASASAWSDNVTISTYQTLEGTIHHMGSGSVAPNPEFYSFWATLDGYNQITIRLEYTD
jgi:hypothetical protein